LRGGSGREGKNEGLDGSLKEGEEEGFRPGEEV
jgi:hypothetical protein